MFRTVAEEVVTLDEGWYGTGWTVVEGDDVDAEDGGDDMIGDDEAEVKTGPGAGAWARLRGCIEEDGVSVKRTDLEAEDRNLPRQTRSECERGTFVVR